MAHSALFYYLEICLDRRSLLSRGKLGCFSYDRRGKERHQTLGGNLETGGFIA